VIMYVGSRFGIVVGKKKTETRGRLVEDLRPI
jgi:hypothetical protein